jgi:hypothetical protein
VAPAISPTARGTKQREMMLFVLEPVGDTEAARIA